MRAIAAMGRSYSDIDTVLSLINPAICAATGDSH
jgi:hypothetical protein